MKFFHSSVFVVNIYRKTQTLSKNRTLKLQLKVVTGAKKYLLNEIKDMACPQMKLIVRPIQPLEPMDFS